MTKQRSESRSEKMYDQGKNIDAMKTEHDPSDEVAYQMLTFRETWGIVII